MSGIDHVKIVLGATKKENAKQGKGVRSGEEEGQAAVSS